MLTGKAKKDYQREYMRNLRKNKHTALSTQKQGSENASGLTTIAKVEAVRPIRPSVRPTLNQFDDVRPDMDNVRPFAGELTKERQTSTKGFNL